MFRHGGPVGELGDSLVTAQHLLQPLGLVPGVVFALDPEVLRSKLTRISGAHLENDNLSTRQQRLSECADPQAATSADFRLEEAQDRKTLVAYLGGRASTGRPLTSRRVLSWTKPVLPRWRAWIGSALSAWKSSVEFHSSVIEKRLLCLHISNPKP